MQGFGVGLVGCGLGWFEASVCWCRMLQHQQHAPASSRQRKCTHFCPPNRLTGRDGDGDAPLLGRFQVNVGVPGRRLGYQPQVGGGGYGGRVDDARRGDEDLGVVRVVVGFGWGWVGWVRFGCIWWGERWYRGGRKQASPTACCLLCLTRHSAHHPTSRSPERPSHVGVDALLAQRPPRVHHPQPRPGREDLLQPLPQRVPPVVAPDDVPIGL